MKAGCAMLAHCLHAVRTYVQLQNARKINYVLHISTLYLSLLCQFKSPMENHFSPHI